MALATISDTPTPATKKPGLSARMSSLSSALGALVADLDPGLLLGSDAVSLYGDFCRLERLVTAGKTLLAPRIEEAGSWEADGHRSAAGLLATLEGGTTGNARRTLEAGRALSDLPGTEEALRQGSLSGSKLSEVTQAGTLDPGSEDSLLAGIEDQSLQVIKERCQRLVTRRRSAPPGTSTSVSTGSTSKSKGSKRSTAPVDPTDPTDPSDLDDPTDPTDLGDLDLGSADDLITAAPPATVIVRVDLEALRRGRALPGELCELDGQGPVPVKVAQSLLDDAFVALVFTEAGDIRSVAHRGRTINAHLRTALVLRDRCCVVPGCGVAYGLEIDHVEPLEFGGDTRLDNLALLCRHHHRLKTYDGWTLERTGPTDEDPRWCFAPLPPFGQEPDLGLDRPLEPVPRE